MKYGEIIKITGGSFRGYRAEIVGYDPKNADPWRLRLVHSGGYVWCPRKWMEKV
jgi:hypothetical protein